MRVAYALPAVKTPGPQNMNLFCEARYLGVPLGDSRRGMGRDNGGAGGGPRDGRFLFTTGGIPMAFSLTHWDFGIRASTGRGRRLRGGSRDGDKTRSDKNTKKIDVHRGALRESRKSRVDQ